MITQVMSGMMKKNITIYWTTHRRKELLTVMEEENERKAENEGESRSVHFKYCNVIPC